MGIEKKVEKLRLRVVECESKSAQAIEQADVAMGRAEESVAACNRFRKAVEELFEHTRSNTEVIIEHIATLDTERKEVIQEYRDELLPVQNEFTKLVEGLKSELSAASGVEV